MSYEPIPYPRWIEHDGRKFIVKNHVEHSRVTGIPHDEHANPIKQEPEDPEPVAPPSPKPDAPKPRGKGLRFTKKAESADAADAAEPDAEPHGDEPEAETEPETATEQSE